MCFIIKIKPLPTVIMKLVKFYRFQFNIANVWMFLQRMQKLLLYQ